MDEIQILLGQETRSRTETLSAEIQLPADFYGQVITACKAGFKMEVLTKLLNYNSGNGSAIIYNLQAALDLLSQWQMHCHC